MTVSETSLHDFALTGIDGKPMPLSQFAGRVVLLVNTASECGYTPQYQGLEKLWLEYKDKGLVVVGVPCNDFGAQEPGEAAHPLYRWAGAQAGMLGRPSWNFHKYLFGRDGKFVDWFSTPTKPSSGKIIAVVEKALAQ